MPLTPDDFSFLKQLYQDCNPNLPLRPGSEAYRFYQPVYEAPGSDDPIDLLQQHIQLSDVESRQFFSGFRGSGKTTELFRLKQRLEELGYLVFYADALKYLNPADPLDIANLLVILAGAFSDALEEFDEGVDMRSESYWARFRHFLETTQVEVSEVSLSAANLGNIKLALKDSPSFRQRLQELAKSRLYDLESQVKKYFEDCVIAIRKRYPSRRIVFLFDQLEQVRGTSLSNQAEVISSVRTLFESHVQRLNLPYIHVVYTVPPWLKFVFQGLDLVVLHSVRQWANDEARTEFPPGNDSLFRLMQKRFGPAGLQRFFGDETRALQLVEVSGGHIQDLLRLTREAVLRAGKIAASH